MGGVFAEKLVIIKGTAKTSSSTNETTVEPQIGYTPNPEPLPLQAISTAAPTPRLAVIKAVLHEGDNDESENAPSSTSQLASSTSSPPTSVASAAITSPAVVAPKAPIAAAVADAAKPAVACGKKTRCYDYMTSMNAACPAVRYGG